jgi:putative FmdB family regulatory protein
MPMYEFACRCGKTFEEMLRGPLESHTCPVCQQDAPRKVSRINRAVFSSFTGNEDIDTMVGRDADRRWQMLEKRQKTRDKTKQEVGSDRLTLHDDGRAEALTETRISHRREVLNAYDTQSAENPAIDGDF